MPIRSPAHAAFGGAVRGIRDERGISQEALALECGIDRTYISGIERGVRNPSLTNILKIAAALAVRPAEIFARAQSPAAPCDAGPARRGEPPESPGLAGSGRRRG
jgi:transcriptional regulator with XRE-family HTH domain